ncbi:hypothetical protein J2128_001685 [Methanomicrobium sp. W14]|uniref:hypothetical protein n=1 Tax=Methanomicrobium sp. W14 TaxID=2817839 RepID=UPI001AE2A948|nr:hypothetical protein [Methanomicrobium sp. W14]MBP2133731.1 hypothetical protein [Methanomicrobium sp. W14]
MKTSEMDFLHPFPKSLHAEIDIGIFVKEESLLGEMTEKALLEILKKLEKSLDNTPATYCILLPFEKNPGHELMEKVLLSRKPDRKSPIDIVLVKKPYKNASVLNAAEKTEPFNKEIRYRVTESDENSKTSGYDPVSDKIAEISNLIIVVGEWEPKLSKYRRGSVFALAKHYGTTIIAINPDNAEICEIPHEDRIFESYKNLNEYNSEKLPRKAYEKRVEMDIATIKKEAKNSGLSEELVKDLYTSMIPHFTRSKMLSEKYRFFYSLAGTSVPLLAALAVFTITIQTLFFHDYPELVWFEVIEILMIILLMAGSRYGGYHRKWIDYNFFSERIRAAFFLYVACIICKKPDTPPHMSLAHRPNDWMVIAFESVIRETPLKYCRIETPFEPVKSFIISAWINNRLSFYRREGKNSAKKYRILSLSGELLFLLTLILAVIHALGIGHWEDKNISGSLVLAALTITMPALAAAVSSIRVQREYLRNAERYSHIERHIASIKNEVEHVSDMNRLREFLEEMNEITLREQQDWRIIFRFRDIEPV